MLCKIRGKFTMNLKELRKENKKTQQDIAQILNISQATYGRYELDSIIPPIETLCKLADYYRVSLDCLVGRNFTNDIGYLTEKQRSALEIVKMLNERNLEKAVSYMSGILAVQD